MTAAIDYMETCLYGTNRRNRNVAAALVWRGRSLRPPHQLGGGAAAREKNVLETVSALTHKVFK